MSSTTTHTRTAQTILRDYELHHSTAPDTPNDDHHNLQVVGSPAWETAYQRVPPYRPAHRDRDQSQIRVYTSNVERVFIATMFTGVFINAVSILRKF